MNQVQRDGNAYKNKEYFQDNQGCPAQAAKIEPVVSCKNLHVKLELTFLGISTGFFPG